MAREGYLILDSDLHMMEPDDLWARYLDEPYRANPPRFFGGQQQKLAESAEDKGNADVDRGDGGAGACHPGARQVAGRRRVEPRIAAQKPGAPPAFQCRPGARLRSGLDPDGDGYRGHRRRRDVRHARAADPVPRRSARPITRRHSPAPTTIGPPITARPIRSASNSPRRSRCTTSPMAVAEARRCVTELGAVAVIGTPNPVNGQHLHDEACEPLWDELERLNVPIGFHPTGNTSLKDDAGRALCRPCQFSPDRACHPQPGRADGGDRQHDHRRRPRTPSEAALRLSRRDGRVALLVAVAARRPMGEVRTRLRAPDLTMLPSEYFKRQCYIALDVDEEPAVDVVNKMGAEYFVVSSDYPHSDGAFPEAIEQFLGLPLNDEQRRKILWDNCARLYAIETPAMPLTRDQKTVSAAE